MKPGWVAVFQGPQKDSDDVVSMLRGEGIKTEVLEQPRIGAFANSYLDARVFVRVGDLKRSRELLRRNPRWKPVDEKTELAEARQSYRFFWVAAAVLGAVALTLIAGLWIGAR